MKCLFSHLDKYHNLLRGRVREDCINVIRLEQNVAMDANCFVLVVYLYFLCVPLNTKRAIL